MERDACVRTHVALLDRIKRFYRTKTAYVKKYRCFRRPSRFTVFLLRSSSENTTDPPTLRKYWTAADSAVPCPRYIRQSCYVFCIRASDDNDIIGHVLVLFVGIFDSVVLFVWQGFDVRRLLAHTRHADVGAFCKPHPTVETTFLR